MKSKVQKMYEIQELFLEFVADERSRVLAQNGVPVRFSDRLWKRGIQTPPPIFVSPRLHRSPGSSLGPVRLHDQSHQRYKGLFLEIVFLILPGKSTPDPWPGSWRSPRQNAGFRSPLPRSVRRGFLLCIGMIS